MLTTDGTWGILPDIRSFAMGHKERLLAPELMIREFEKI